MLDLPPPIQRAGTQLDLNFLKMKTGWAGKIYPSGHFAIWRQNGTKTVGFKEAFVSAGAGQFRGKSLDTLQEVQGEEIVHRWWRMAKGMDLSRLQEGGAEATSAVVTVGSSTPVNSEKKRRGLGGLTSRGKNLVREAAIGLEKRFGKKNLTFWTVTLPELSQEDWRSVCENWSKIVKNVKEKLLYWMEKKGCPKHVVAVTELQEKRWKKTGVPGWHMHLVFVGKTSTGGWLLTPKRADKIWRESVENFITDRVGFQSSSKLQQVKKSVGRYLSKYLSKGVSVIQEVEEKWPGCVPSSFYICTNSLKQWVDKQTRKSEWIGEWIYQAMMDSKEMFEWMWAYTIETRPGQPLAVSWLGVLAEPPPADYSDL